MITPDTNTNKNDVEDTKINNDNSNNNDNKDNNINNDVNNNSNENENTIENKINNNDNENIVNNKEESLQNSGEKKKSRAALYMFLSIIVILAIIISLVACFAKFKNVKHEKAMKQSLLHNRMMLQKYKSEEDTFFKDTAVRSMDDQFTLSKYSGSVYTDSGSNSNSHSDSGNRSKLSNINTSNYEHAILMQNIDGIPQSSTPKDGNDEYDNDGSNTSLSRTIDLSFTDASYSLTTNPYTSSCYDSSYCSTCDVSHSTEQSSFTSEIDSSISLSCHNSNYMSSYSYSNTNTTKNTNTVEDNSSNITLDSSIGDYGYDPNKNYLTKRSIVSNTSGRTLINRTGSSNAGTSTSSVLSSTGTVTTAATKFMEEENMKMVLEDIAEENSAELSRINNNNNQTIDLSLDDSSLGKGLNISYIFKDSSFFNDTPKKEESFTLNW